MVKSRTLKIGLISTNAIPDKNVEIFLKNRDDVYGQLCFLLLEFLQASYKVSSSDTGGVLLDNGSWTGLIGMLNRSKIDLALTSFYVTEDRNEAVHFAYPFNLDDLTFITRKPKYSPNMFAFISTVSSKVWIVLMVSTVLMMLFNYLFRNKKYHSFSIIMMNIMAIFFNQPMATTKMSEKCLIYSWIIGMTFLIHSYKSVLLSFLTLPVLVGVTDVKELAKAVQDGDYNCMIYEGTSFPVFLSMSKERSFKIIGDNLLENPYGFGSIEKFFHLTDEKLAYVESREEVAFVQDRYFISNDRFLHYMKATATTKDFCCKEQLDLGVHRLLAGGFHKKFLRVKDFKIASETFTSKTAEVDQRRSLTLTDLSSAFIILVSGYCISLLVLIFETIVHRSKKKCKFPPC